MLGGGLVYIIKGSKIKALEQQIIDYINEIIALTRVFSVDTFSDNKAAAPNMSLCQVGAGGSNWILGTLIYICTKAEQKEFYFLIG